MCDRKPWRAWACVQRAARASAHGRRKFIAREACSELGEVHRSIGLQAPVNRQSTPLSVRKARLGRGTASAVPVPPRRPRASLGRPGPSQNAPGRSRTRWPFQNALAVPGRASRPRPRQRVAEQMRRPRPPQAVPARTGRPSTGQARPRTPWASQNAPGHPRTPRPPQNATRHPGAAGVLGTRRRVLWWEPVQNAALRARPRGPSQNAPLRTGTRLWPP